MPWWISLKTPLAFVGIGLVLALLTYPKPDAAAPFFAVALLWALFTGRSRKTYWSARLRTRAHLDERAARSK